jgi:hypothetical protein
MDRSPQPPEPSSRPAPPEAEPPLHGAHDTDPPEATGDYVDGVPTFDFVRDRIESRYATAVGATELAEETTAGRSLEQQQEDRDAAARERLEQIRRSLRDG